MINSIKQFEDIGNATTVYKGFIPSVAISAVGPIEQMKMPSEIEVLYINLTAKSTNFDFHIFSKANAVIGEPSNVFTLTGIDKEYSPEKGITSISPSNLTFFFKNEDTKVQPAMYLQIVNNDGSNATGVVTLEIGIKQA